MMPMLQLSCCPLLANGTIDRRRHEMVRLDAVILIDTITVNKDRFLRLRTTEGDFVFNMTGSLNVVGEMLEPYGFFRSDNCNLVNTAHIDKVVETVFKSEVRFRGTEEVKGDISKSKVKALKQLFPQVSVIKGGLL